MWGPTSAERGRRAGDRLPAAGSTRSRGSRRRFDSIALHPYSSDARRSLGAARGGARGREARGRPQRRDLDHRARLGRRAARRQPLRQGRARAGAAALRRADRRSSERHAAFASGRVLVLVARQARRRVDLRVVRARRPAGQGRLREARLESVRSGGQALTRPARDGWAVALARGRAAGAAAAARGGGRRPRDAEGVLRRRRRRRALDRPGLRARWAQPRSGPCASSSSGPASTPTEPRATSTGRRPTRSIGERGRERDPAVAVPLQHARAGSPRSTAQLRRRLRRLRPRGQGGAGRLVGFPAAPRSQRYGPGGEFWTENPERPEAADPRLAALERAELAELLRAEAEGAGLREAARRRPRRDRRAAIRGAEIVLGGMFGTPRGAASRRSRHGSTSVQALRREGRQAQLRRGRPAPLRTEAEEREAPDRAPARGDQARGRSRARALDHRDRLGLRRAAESAQPRPGRPGEPPHPSVQVLREEAKEAEHPQRRLVLVARQPRRPAVDSAIWCPYLGPRRQDLGEKPSLRAFTKFTGGN